MYTYDVTEKDKRIAEIKAEYYRLTERDKLLELRKQYENKYTKDDSNPKVFIYTPTYNRGELLKERALKSVLEQTYENFEYMIFGDSCSDDTEKIVRECGDNRVKFINLPSRDWRYPPTSHNHWLAGPVVAANTALMLANGKWIARLDDDDYWVKDHLETMISFAVENNHEFVSGVAKTIQNGNETISELKDIFSDYFHLSPEDAPVPDYCPKVGATSSFVYRSYLRSFLYNIDCWRKDWNSVNDTDLIVRFGLMGVRMGALNRVEFVIQPREGESAVQSEAYRIHADKMEEKYYFI